MTAIWIMLSVSVMVFSLMQAIYTRRKAHRESIDRALFARVGVEAAEENSLFRDEKRDIEGRVATLLEQSGLKWTVNGFFQRLILLVVLASTTTVLLVGVGGLFFGMMVPAAGVFAYVFTMRDRRMARMSKQMPKTLQLLVLTLRAGHALPRAVHLVSKEIDSPLREELVRVYEEHTLGRPLEEAFMAMERRIPKVAAVKIFVTALLVLRQTGGNLIEVIERMMSTISSQEQYVMKLRAATAEGRTSAILVGGLPGIFLGAISFIRPEHTKYLFQDSGGQLMFAFAMMLWAAGLVWVYRLTRVAA